MHQLTLAAALGAMSVVVVVEATWLARSLSAEPRFRRLSDSWLPTLCRILFLLGLPYIALISGLLPARFFGLTGLADLVSVNLNQPGPRLLVELQLLLGAILLAWLPILGRALLVGLGALLAVGLALIVYHRSFLRPGRPSPADLPGPVYASSVDLLLDAVHWSFYRALVWLLAGNLYVGVWGGVILIGLELTTAAYVGKISPEQHQQYLWRFMLAVLTSLCFFFAPDFWLILVLHFGLVWLVQAGLRAIAHSQAGLKATS
ncbi:MAG: hypothetical protein ACE5H9_00610 [Anaerolineae bacterium]